MAVQPWTNRESLGTTDRAISWETQSVTSFDNMQSVQSISKLQMAFLSYSTLQLQQVGVLPSPSKNWSMRQHLCKYRGLSLVTSSYPDSSMCLLQWRKTGILAWERSWDMFLKDSEEIMQHRNQRGLPTFLTHTKLLYYCFNWLIGKICLSTGHYQTRAVRQDLGTGGTCWVSEQPLTSTMYPGKGTCRSWEKVS